LDKAIKETKDPKPKFPLNSNENFKKLEKKKIIS